MRQALIVSTLVDDAVKRTVDELTLGAAAALPHG